MASYDTYCGNAALYYIYQYLGYNAGGFSDYIWWKAMDIEVAKIPWIRENAEEAAATILSLEPDIADSGCVCKHSQWNLYHAVLYFTKVPILIEFDNHIQRGLSMIKVVELPDIVQETCNHRASVAFSITLMDIIAEMNRYQRLWRFVRQYTYMDVADAFETLINALQHEEIDVLISSILAYAYGDRDYYSLSIPFDRHTCELRGYNLFGSLYGENKTTYIEQCVISRESNSCFAVVTKSGWQLKLKLITKGMYAMPGNLFLKVTATEIPDEYKRYKIG